MIEQGLILMVAGMSVVFVFLTIMVMVMHGSAAVLRTYFPEPAKPAPAAPRAAPPAARPAVLVSEPEPVVQTTPGSEQAAAQEDDAVQIAVAVAAIQAHLHQSR